MVILFLLLYGNLGLRDALHCAMRTDVAIHFVQALSNATSIRPAFGRSRKLPSVRA